MVLAILAVLLAANTVAALDLLGVFTSSSSRATEGSGTPAAQARVVRAFNSIELAGGNNVAVHVGGEQSVVVKADDNLLNRVTTNVKSGTLVIGNTGGSLEPKSPMSVEVVVPSLNAVALTGSGNIRVRGIETDVLAVSLSGSGNIVGSGTATSLDVTVSGSGNAQFGQLAANDVRSAISGFGAIFVTATKSLDASISGSGTIAYAGDPEHVATSVTGSGAITRTYPDPTTRSAARR